MRHLPIILSQIPTRYHCPQCNGKGEINQEICPLCSGAKWVDISTATNWVLDMMESQGCDISDINELRETTPDPLTLGLFLELLMMVNKSIRDRN